MKDLYEMYTVAEVDEFIDHICWNMPPGFRAEVESRMWTAAERAASMKLDAVLKALARRQELEEEIRSGIRAPDGILNVPV